MRAILSISLLTLVFFCSLSGIDVFAETSAANRGIVESARSELEALNAQKPSDRVFQFNTGLNTPKEIAKITSNYLNPEAKKLADTDIDSLDNARLENAEKKLNQQFEEKGRVRKETANKINQKHKRYEQLEIEIDRNSAKAQRKLNDALDQKARQQEKTSKALDAEIKTQTRKINQAKVKKQHVRTKKMELGKARAKSRYLKIRTEIAATKRKIAAMKKSMKFGAKGGKALNVAGLVLTAFSSEMEENALAEKEGRKPLAVNKLINFTKNISGYSAVKGVMDNVEIAKMEAMVSTMEFYINNDFDLDDPEVQKMVMQRAEDAARRAVAKTAMYEGAKLAPLAGDLINIKESFDAAGQAYVAIEEATYIVAGNQETNFQMGLKTAVRADAKVSEMDKIVEQTNQLVASLGKLKAQLLNMEKAASGNREKVTQAIQTLEAYNEQAQALQNPAVASSLDEANTDALLARINAIKASADEQIGNMTRVKSEHASGELTPQGVANQTKFIGDLLQPSIDDYANLQPTLSGIEAIGKGAEFAAQVPQALELLRQGKGVMQEEAQRTDELYATYREQAGNLKELSDRFKTLKQELAKNQSFLDTSTNLEQVHRERIRATVARSRDIDINKNAITKAIEDARGLRNSVEMVSALAALDKAPPAVDSSQVNALVGGAQQVWGKLSGPNQATSESLLKAQGLLNELLALSRDTEPTEINDAKEVSEKVPSKLKGKLFAGKNWLELSPEDIENIIENIGEEKSFVHKDYFGFKAYDFPPGVRAHKYCSEIKDHYCPSDGKLYRVLETGTTDYRYGNDTYNVPYWIAYEIRDFVADLDLYGVKIEPIEKNSQLNFRMDSANFHKESPVIPKINLRHADDALILTKSRDDGWVENTLFASKGPLTIYINGDTECFVGATDGLNDKRQLWTTHIIAEKDWILDVFSKSFIDSCLAWKNSEKQILSEFTDQLFAESEGLLSKIKNKFYLKPFKLNVTLDGYEQTHKNDDVDFSNGAGFRFSKYKDVEVSKGTTSRIGDSYEVYVRMRAFHFSHKINDVIEKLDQLSDELVEKRLQFRNSSEYRDVKINLEGTDYSRMASRTNVYTRKTDNFTQYTKSGLLIGRVENVTFEIRYDATYLQDQPTRVLDVAKLIIRKLKSMPKGW